MNVPWFLIPILCGLAAQALKPFLNKKRDAQSLNLPRYGGMPSAHTAFAVSLATVVGLAGGFASVSFALATAFLVYTLDDALRMRIFLGRYGWALKHLVQKLPDKEQKDYPYIEQQLGHKPPEVVAGAVLGFALTLIVWFSLKSL